jgi:hypothetical protein
MALANSREAFQIHNFNLQMAHLADTAVLPNRRTHPGHLPITKMTSIQTFEVAMEDEGETDTITSRIDDGPITINQSINTKYPAAIHGFSSKRSWEGDLFTTL